MKKLSRIEVHLVSGGAAPAFKMELNADDVSINGPMTGPSGALVVWNDGKVIAQFASGMWIGWVALRWVEAAE